MDIGFYQDKDWSKQPVREIFAVVDILFNKMKKDYKNQLEEGKVSTGPLYNHVIDFMVKRLESIDYSDDLKCSIKASGIAFAESILKDPYYIRKSNEWDSVKKSKGDLTEFGRVMQRKINESFSKHRQWGMCNRDTSIEIVTQEPHKDFLGRSRILQGSYGFIGARISYNHSRIMAGKHSENIRMNNHPASAVKTPTSWLSVLFHENAHAIEEIERQQVMCKPATDIADNIDAQLLLADDKFPQTAEFRAMCYDAYRALPSERLAREVGQAAFEGRMNAERRLVA